MKALPLLALPLVLAACSGGSDEPAPAPNETTIAAPFANATENLTMEEAMGEVAPTPTPTATPSPVATEARAPDEQQMLDDAATVGDTARVNRGETGSNEAQPAQ